MATTPAPEPKDPLTILEERIVKTVEVISELREEREIIMKDLEAAIAARQVAEAAIEPLRKENESLRAEHAAIKARIQKVLGQLDQLTNA